MKFLKVFLTFIIIAIIASCSDKTPTAPEKTYSICYIKTLDILSMPMTDNVGGGWDLGSGADVYFIIVNPYGQKLTGSGTNRYDDVTTSKFPLSFVFPAPYFKLPALEEKTTIQLWDYDSCSDDDFIGSVDFLALNYTTGANKYPLSVTVAFGSTNVTLGLKWE